MVFIKVSKAVFEIGTNTHPDNESRVCCQYRFLEWHYGIIWHYAGPKQGATAIGRRELENNEGYELKEPQSPYNRVFDPEKCRLRLKNDYIWQVS